MARLFKSKTSDELGEFTISREYDAPRETVFRAWTDPEQLANWFRPAGMTVPPTQVTVDLREGGGFELVMVSEDDGTEIPSRGEYLEVIEPERIVFAEPEIGMTTSVAFTDLGGTTAMTVHQTDVPPEYSGPGVGADLNSTLDNLAQHLASVG